MSRPTTEQCRWAWSERQDPDRVWRMDRPELRELGWCEEEILRRVERYDALVAALRVAALRVAVEWVRNGWNIDEVRKMLADVDALLAEEDAHEAV